MRILFALCTSGAMMACDVGNDTGARNQALEFSCTNGGPCIGAGCNYIDPRSEEYAQCAQDAVRLVQPSHQIKDEADTVVGYVDLYFSPSCCAMWAETTAIGDHSDPDEIAAFMYVDSSDFPQADPRPQPLVDGYTNIWWSAMTAADPDAVACGWFRSNGQRYGMCSTGADINHPPICTGARSNPPSMLAGEEGVMFQSMLIEIEGVYDPDGDPFVIWTVGIEQNQYTQGTMGGAGQSCPDGSVWQDAQGNRFPLINRERSGNNPPCRIYQSDFRAYELQRDGDPGALLYCDGQVTTHIMHDPSVPVCVDDDPDWVSSLKCPCDSCTWPYCPSYCPRRRVP